MTQGPFNNAAGQPADPAPNTASNSWMETAWQKFTPYELVMWVHLFTKSGTLRQEGAAPEKKDIEKSVKDLHMARHYLDMLKKKVGVGVTDDMTASKPVSLLGLEPQSEIIHMAPILAANAEIAKTQPEGSTRHSFALSNIRTVLCAIEERLDGAENSARPEVRAELEKTSHWKKKSGGPNPAL